MWARGYGLIDSSKIQTAPGKISELEAGGGARCEGGGADYPANYWFSLLKVPEKSEFPGTGPSGNGISPACEEPGPSGST